MALLPEWVLWSAAKWYQDNGLAYTADRILVTNACKQALPALVNPADVRGELFRNGALSRRHSGGDPHPLGSQYPSAPMTCRWQQPLVPGCAFGDDQHVRLSYDPATLDKGMARLAAYGAQLALLSVGEGKR